MSIGYACQTVGVPDTRLRSCTMKTANEANLTTIIAYNLEALDRILDYNIANDIKLFRISSDLIPFGSSPANTLNWWEIFGDKFIMLGNKIAQNHIRVSMHPGQYTVLNSPNALVVDRAVKDLEYHNRVLDCLNLDKTHKIILHIGGIYNDIEQATLRFIDQYNTLSQGIKNRLILENDDKLFNIKDVLEIASKVQAPVVFDNLHHKINLCEGEQDEFIWIRECQKTWKAEDGSQKIHYSQQHPQKRTGSHSDTISAKEFAEFYQGLNREDIDIMLEVKDKNLSTVKCMNVISTKQEIKRLELEWSRYKYSILERSHREYNEIRSLLRQKDNYPVIEFYNIIDNAMSQEITVGNGVNAAQHVWGYFKDIATEKEKSSFEKRLNQYAEGRQSLLSVRKYLWGLSLKYSQKYLVESNYFRECY